MTTGTNITNSDVFKMSWALGQVCHVRVWWSCSRHTIVASTAVACWFGQVCAFTVLTSWTLCAVLLTHQVLLVTIGTCRALLPVCTCTIWTVVTLWTVMLCRTLNTYYTFAKHRCYIKKGCKIQNTVQIVLRYGRRKYLRTTSIYILL